MNKCLMYVSEEWIYVFHVEICSAGLERRDRPVEYSTNQIQRCYSAIMHLRTFCMRYVMSRLLIESDSSCHVC